MNVISRVIIRIRNLMLYPAKEWETIEVENSNRKTVYFRFVLPLLGLIAITTIIGTWLDTSREIYSIGYVCCRIAILWTSLSAGLFVSAFVITEVMSAQVNSKDHNRSFALLAYSSGAAFLVIAIVAMFPFFKELLVLAFYSCYLYWQGIPFLIRIEGQKQMIYGLFSFIVVALIYLLMFFFFEKIMTSIFI